MKPRMIAQFESLRFALLVFTILASSMVRGADLVVLTEEYPPVTFTRDGKVTGLATEVVEEIQRRIGDATPIQVVPWKRGYEAALTQPNVALFAAMRTSERESLFKWVGPLTTVKTSFYGLRGSKVKASSLADAKAIKGLLVPKEYYTHQFLKGKGFENLTPTLSPETMVRMLLAKRSLLMATDNLTLSTLLAHAGGKIEDVELVHTFMTSQNYIAFSQGTPDEVVRRWQVAMDQMKKDGSFARIYKKWLPYDTPAGIKPLPAWEEG